ncbi:translation initiation factor IF-2-like [Antechinus flavipes]|uniref:translation initiation factor IF-2-like n=1 Tax=Antechinus flavipes TaxID=38775 RepID=UPI00223576AF|nr:translation initiation factor IF-2-like [Antechinus flavipes]
MSEELRSPLPLPAPIPPPLRWPGPAPLDLPFPSPAPSPHQQPPSQSAPPHGLFLSVSFLFSLPRPPFSPVPLGVSQPRVGVGVGGCPPRLAHGATLPSVCSILTPRPCQCDHRRDTGARRGAGERGTAEAEGGGVGVRPGRMNPRPKFPPRRVPLPSRPEPWGRGPDGSGGGAKELREGRGKGGGGKRGGGVAAQPLLPKKSPGRAAGLAAAAQGLEDSLARFLALPPRSSSKPPRPGRLLRLRRRRRR